jgi:triosephosphate isomerase
MQAALSKQHFDNVDMAICPPFTLLHRFNSGELAFGAQDISLHDSGAYTGEVSGRLLKEAGCKYVLVGHSERREYHNETDTDVANKAKAALSSGLTPIVCFGESEEIREQGDYLAFLKQQINAVVAGLGIDAFAQLILAYEPVWAIGTGKTASPAQAQEVHASIRQHLAQLNSDIAAKVCILYGGSVKAENAESLFGNADVDGGLIGGASLKENDFIAICQSANIVSER